MTMIHLPLPSICRTRKTSYRLLVFGEDWRCFAIMDIGESNEASDAPCAPSRAN